MGRYYSIGGLNSRSQKLDRIQPVRLGLQRVEFCFIGNKMMSTQQQSLQVLSSLNLGLGLLLRLGRN